MMQHDHQTIVASVIPGLEGGRGEWLLYDVPMYCMVCSVHCRAPIFIATWKRTYCREKR